MKQLLILIFVLFSSLLFAPAHPVLTIPAGDVLRPYDRLIKALVTVESGGNNYAYNAREGAVGAFQIRAIRLKDFNQRAGKSYKLREMYDYDKAKEVFLYYCQGDYESVAKDWNKSTTEKYWNKVQIYLYN